LGPDFDAGYLAFSSPEPAGSDDGADLLASAITAKYAGENVTPDAAGLIRELWNAGLLEDPRELPAALAEKIRQQGLNITTGDLPVLSGSMRCPSFHRDR
jgi:hypothetical protein